MQPTLIRHVQGLKLCANLVHKLRNVPMHQKLRHESQFNCLLKNIHKSTKPSQKISIVGCGQVGSSIAAFLLLRNLSKNLVLYDSRYDWAKAEALDLLHGSRFLGSPSITACGNGDHTENSDIVIITAGARPTGKEQSRLAILNKTAEILRNVVPKLVRLSPNAVFIVISNPADVMTRLVQQVGKLEKHRCFSTGCHLDTARFCYLIAKRLNVPTSSVHGYMIGEHGSSAVPVWSSVTVAGVPLSRIIPELGTSQDTENWQKVYQDVINAATVVGLAKGYTNWAVALTAVDVVQSMRDNNGCILCLSTDMYGVNCIDEHVALSLPCAVTSEGISRVLELPLNDIEQKKLLKSADVLLEAQCSINV